MSETKSYTYLLRCADGSLYGGWTGDLQKRLDAHNSGAGAKYTRSRRPVTLAWAVGAATKEDAMRLEFYIKHLPKAKKEELVAGAPLAEVLPAEVLERLEQPECLEPPSCPEPPAHPSQTE